MITVIAATHNGAHTLPRFLDALCRLETCEPWKLILVDNASTDETNTIIQSFTTKLPLTYLHESKKGKNVALNSALPQIEGDIVVFTDDDVIPEPDWLDQYRKAINEHSDYTIFGGAILPYWEGEPTILHLEAVPQGPTYALTKPHWENGPCSPFRIWGANMAIRACVFEQGYTFDETIGPNSQNKNYTMGSETSLTSHLVKQGYKCWHLPEVKIQHIIRSNQMQPDWVFQRGIRYGRSLYDPPDANYSPLRLAGYPGYLIRRWLVAAVGFCMACMTFNLKRIYQAKWQVNVCRGALMEAKIRHESEQ